MPRAPTHPTKADPRTRCFGCGSHAKLEELKDVIRGSGRPVRVGAVQRGLHRAHCRWYLPTQVRQYFKPAELLPSVYDDLRACLDERFPPGTPFGLTAVTGTADGAGRSDQIGYAIDFGELRDASFLRSQAGGAPKEHAAGLTSSPWPKRHAVARTSW